MVVVAPAHDGGPLAERSQQLAQEPGRDRSTLHPNLMGAGRRTPRHTGTVINRINRDHITASLDDTAVMYHWARIITGGCPLGRGLRAVGGGRGWVGGAAPACGRRGAQPAARPRSTSAAAASPPPGRSRPGRPAAAGDNSISPSVRRSELKSVRGAGGIDRCWLPLAVAMAVAVSAADRGACVHGRTLGKSNLRILKTRELKLILKNSLHPECCTGPPRGGMLSCFALARCGWCCVLPSHLAEVGHQPLPQHERAPGLELGPEQIRVPFRRAGPDKRALRGGLGEQWVAQREGGAVSFEASLGVCWR